MAKTEIQKELNLGKRDYIVAVRPQRAGGPGWANQPLWVFVLRENETITQECIQPEHFTRVMRALYAPGELIIDALIAEIEREARGARTQEATDENA